MKKTIFIILISFVFIKCKKETKINKAMEGTWTVTEYNTKKSTVTDFSSEKRTLQFIKEKKAYTKSLTAYYNIDYTDPSKKDFIDTLKYELKKDEITFSSAKSKKGSSIPAEIVFIFSRRFKISDYKSSNIKLTRVDSTDLYINITK